MSQDSPPTEQKLKFAGKQEAEILSKAAQYSRTLALGLTQ